MSTTYSDMGLKSWNSASDIFSYTELDANWAAINAHDHTGPGKGLQIPAGGLANNAVTAAAIAAGSIDDSKINASAAIVGTKLAALTIAGDRIANNTITDGKLTSPILRGVVNSSGTVAQGVGSTCTRPVTGQYDIVFSSAYSAAPIAFVGSSAATVFADSVITSTTGMTVYLTTLPTGGVATNAKFNFMVIASS